MWSVRDHIEHAIPDLAPDLDTLIRCWFAAIGISASERTYKDFQQTPMYLPEVMGTNEEGRPSMTKEELEMFIDRRWKSNFERLVKEVKELKRRVNELESKNR
jgi:hypothetical protein